MSCRNFFIRSFVLFLFVFVFVSTNSFAQSGGSASDVILVLPFENTTPDQRENNWIGESFSDQLTDLLNIPGIGVVKTKKRELIYQKIGLPQSVIPTKATALKVARESRASLLILGKYNIIPQQGELPVSIQGSVTVIRVNEGRLMGDRNSTQVYDFGDAVANLQAVQGRLAFQILSQRDRALPYSMKDFVDKSTKIPALAFQAFIKGVLTKDLETRINYFKNALRLYSEANQGKEYPQAAYELGQRYLEQGDWRGAAEYFVKLQKEDRNYVEAAFYASVAYWRLQDYKGALNVLVKLCDECAVSQIYTNTGAISVLASRDEKNPDEQARLIQQAVKYLERASSTSPNNLTIRFNYGYALFLAGKHAEAIEQLRSVVKANERDGQALFLLAKSLEKTGKAEEAESVDDNARRYLPSYAKWQTNWQKNQNANEVSLLIRDKFDQAEVCEITEPPTTQNTTQELLAKVSQLMASGNDEEALKVIRQILTIEPMNAQAYYLTGSIHQRNGDQEAAISALKTAIFWDNKVIEAHVLLSRIYISRGECGLAKGHAKTAIQLDANNQEAIGLQRILEMNKCQ